MADDRGGSRRRRDCTDGFENERLRRSDRLGGVLGRDRNERRDAPSIRVVRDEAFLGRRHAQSLRRGLEGIVVGDGAVHRAEIHHPVHA